MNISNNKEAELFFNNIPWMDDIPVYSRTYPNYAGVFSHYFKNTPCSTCELDDLEFDRLEIQKLLESEGFKAIEYTSSFEFVNFELKSIVSLNISYDFNFDDEKPIVKQNLCIYFSHNILNKERITNIWKLIIKNGFKEKEPNRFFMIAQSSEGLYSKSTNFKAAPIADSRYDLYYGSEFPHEKFIQFMNEDTENLLLLHGDPGTGKSNYIKNLIEVGSKEIIYIPPSMLSVISSPSFVPFIMENKGKILLIEDAEEILSVDRNTATNNLLGLTDGFLKDALNLKVICTFNCELAQIDPALLRKGRLFFEYKFKALPKKDVENLVNHLNLNVDVKGDMTLAEIFNTEDNSLDESLKKEERSIGFF